MADENSVLTEQSEHAIVNDPDMLSLSRREEWQKRHDKKDDAFWELCSEGIPTAMRARVYSDVLRRSKYEEETSK